jgi:threonine/homoserine/homoserine lactone efflux protein
MGYHLTYFKNIPLKLKIIGFIIMIFDVLWLVVYSYSLHMGYYAKYASNLSIDNWILIISTVLFVSYLEYRRKRN